MAIQSNTPISPLTVLENHRKSMAFKNEATDSNQGFNIPQKTVTRVVQESVDAMIRNMGTMAGELVK